MKFGCSRLGARRPCFLTKEGGLDIDRTTGFILGTSFNSRLECLTSAETLIEANTLEPKLYLVNNEAFPLWVGLTKVKSWLMTVLVVHGWWDLFYNIIAYHPFPPFL